jgi:biotin synthase-like enzyme
LDNPLTLDEVEVASRLMKEVGLKRIGLGGGTVWTGAGKYVIEAVRRVKQVAPFDVWVNIGPSLNSTDLAKLKELGVSAVGSSIETLNPKNIQRSQAWR